MFRVVLHLYYHKSVWKSMGLGRTRASVSAADGTRCKVPITQVVKSHVRDSSHAWCGSDGEGSDPLTDHNLASLPIDKKHLRGIPSENTCSKVVAATSRFRTS